MIISIINKMGAYFSSSKSTEDIDVVVQCDDPHVVAKKIIYEDEDSEWRDQENKKMEDFAKSLEEKGHTFVVY